ncbi:hypothetical protein GTY66_11310 [Streptomyces sp. SID8356]|nr:hypothetical protein [Streptomyces sp. SID8356]
MQRAIITLVHLREHTTYAKLAAGSRIGEGTVSGTGPAPRTFPSMSWWATPSPRTTGSATVIGTTRTRPDGTD